MHQYRLHTIESAPENSKNALRALQQNFGRIPHLAATMAESPVLLNVFVGAFSTFHAGAFTAAEKQALLLTNAVTNACSWAVAFHSTLALKEGVQARDVRAIRERRLPDDVRLAALSALTRGLIEKRGHLDERALTAFTEVGFGHDQVLEVIAGLAVSTLANYAGNVTQPVVEEPFSSQLWQPQT